MIGLGRLELRDADGICAARDKVLRLAQDLGLGSVHATRLAAVTSQVARCSLDAGRPGQLAIDAERGAHAPQLRLSFQLDHARRDRALLEAFFERVELLQSGRADCWITLPPGAPIEGESAERLRRMLAERTRAELLADLARQNEVLEQHRAELESTVERRTSELRAETERAEHANRAKSEFLSHMSHELRTPLNGVLGHSQILLRSGDVTPSQRKSLAAIDSSGRHLLTLINDILDLSKIEAGELELEEAPCDIPSLMLDVCNIVRARAESKGVSVEQEIGPGVPRAILTDPTKLRQCLVNIAGNAAKFTDQGSIALRVRRVGPVLQFEVADTGVGISGQDLAELFQPFRQAKAGRAAGGTGLGLAISKHIVERLRGELGVESAVGRGTTFRIELPCHAVAPEGAALQEAPERLDTQVPRLAEGCSCSVLIVDDNETNREVLNTMLGAAGFDLEQAVDGAEALDRMRARRFDLVLMDLRMPRMSGEEALRVIRGDPALAASKVMAVTASLEAGLMANLAQLGFDAVLGKPFLLGALFERIQQLTGVQWVSPEAGSHTAAMAEPGGVPDTEVSASAAREVLPELRRALLVGDLQAISVLGAALQARPDAGVARLGASLCARCGDFDVAGLEAIERRLALLSQGTAV